MLHEHDLTFTFTVGSEIFVMLKTQDACDAQFLTRREDDELSLIPIMERSDFWSVHSKLTAMLRGHYGEGV
jgi:hypothetical protein